MSSKYLLDTNICVFILRNKYNIDSVIGEVGIENCYISEITVAELLYGAECSSNKVLNEQLVYEFCNDLNILSISNCLKVFAKEKARLRKLGYIIDDFDLLIGSTAVYNGCILVTDNLKHFNRLPVKKENWVKKD